MIFNIETKFWDKSNFLSKGLMIVAFFLIDIAMKLNGMEQNEKDR